MKIISFLFFLYLQCVSQWGHDFRTDYRRLHEIRRIIPSVPILAVTATATEHVQDDIISMLKLRNPQKVNMGFDRPNIHFSFNARGKDIWDDLKPFTTLIGGSVIIYVLQKAKSEEIAKILRTHGVTCEIYHAGLSIKKRKEVLEDFKRDRLQVIVATVAFGMGIDKPDVRSIIHYGASKNIERYDLLYLIFACSSFTQIMFISFQLFLTQYQIAAIIRKLAELDVIIYQRKRLHFLRAAILVCIRFF